MYILKMGSLAPKDNTTILSLPVTVVARNERFSIIDLKAELKHTPGGLVLAEAVYNRMVSKTDLSQKITDGLVAVSVSGGKATFTLGSSANTKFNVFVSVPYVAIKGIQRNSLIDLRSYEAGHPEGLTVSDTTYAYLMQNDDFAANITSGKISWSSVDDDGNTEALAVEITKVIPVDADSVADGLADKVVVAGKVNRQTITLKVYNKDNVEIFDDIVTSGGFFEIEIETDKVQTGQNVTVKAIEGSVEASDTAVAASLVYADNLAPVVTITSVTPVDEADPATGVPTKLVIVGSSDELNGVYQIFTSDGTKIDEGTTDAVDGSFAAEIATSAVAPGDIVTVKVMDKAGNVGTSTKVTGTLSFEETTDPTVEVTSVTPVNSEYPAGTVADKAVIVGSSNEAGSIEVFVGEAVIFTGETEQDGSFDLEIVTSLVNAGVNVVVKVTDMAGNVGSGTATAGTLFKENFVELSGSAGVTGKVQVTSDSVLPNTLAFKVTGDYTIDWGDGIRQNFASGSIAVHTYDYATISEDVGTFALQLPGEDSSVDISVKEVSLGIHAQSGSALLTLETDGLVDDYPTCIITDVVLVDNSIDADLAGLFPAVELI